MPIKHEIIVLSQVQIPAVLPPLPASKHTHTRYLNLVLQPPLILQSHKLLNHLVQRDNLTTLLALLIISVPNINSPVLALLGTNDDDEVVQRELRSADLLLHGVARDVDVGVETLGAETLLDFLDVVVDSGHDGDDHDLAGGDPEGPAAGEVLGEDTVRCVSIMFD